MNYLDIDEDKDNRWVDKLVDEHMQLIAELVKSYIMYVEFYITCLYLGMHS